MVNMNCLATKLKLEKKQYFVPVCVSTDFDDWFWKSLIYRSLSKKPCKCKDMLLNYSSITLVSCKTPSKIGLVTIWLTVVFALTRRSEIGSSFTHYCFFFHFYSTTSNRPFAYIDYHIHTTTLWMELWRRRLRVDVSFFVSLFSSLYFSVCAHIFVARRSSYHLSSDQFD